MGNTMQEDYAELAKLVKDAEEAMKKARIFALENSLSFIDTWDDMKEVLDDMRGWEYSAEHYSDSETWAPSEE